jgi:hypothetical protein
MDLSAAEGHRGEVDELLVVRVIDAAKSSILPPQAMPHRRHHVVQEASSEYRTAEEPADESCQPRKPVPGAA